MVVGVCTIDLHLPGTGSLKGKRQILLSLKDRLKKTYNVSIAEVDGNADLRQAWVYVTVLQQGPQEAETLAVLARAEGFIRSELGRRLKLRYVPELTFVKDTSLDRVKRVMTLLDQVQPQSAERKDDRREA